MFLYISKCLLRLVHRSIQYVYHLLNQGRRQWLLAIRKHKNPYVLLVKDTAQTSHNSLGATATSTKSDFRADSE